MIDLQRVSKSYGEAIVVDDVTISLPSSGVTSIIGPNGAGKSTLLSMIGRLLPMDRGAIRIDGLDVTHTSSDIIARRLSLLRQDNHVAARLTVRDLVTFGRYPYSKGRYTLEDRRHVDRAIDYLELRDLSDRYLDELSGGQRQRAFVAMVLCQNTDHVLFDEPLNSLDMKQAVAIMRLIRRAAEELGKTIVVVLHDINFASRYSDRLIAMKNGRIAAQGSPEEIMNPDLLWSIYDMEVRVHSIEGRPLAVYY